MLILAYFSTKSNCRKISYQYSTMWISAETMTDRNLIISLNSNPEPHGILGAVGREEALVAQPLMSKNYQILGT